MLSFTSLTLGTTEDYKPSLERVACFSCCTLAPVLVVDGKVYGRTTSAKAAVTDSAIKIAQRFGVTLIGFARGHQFNLYSHSWRISAKMYRCHRSGNDIGGRNGYHHLEYQWTRG